MYYKFNKKTLMYEEYHVLNKLFKTSVIIGVLFFVFGMLISTSNKIEVDELTESEIQLIILEEKEFTNEKLIDEINQLNFRFPHIVYAQSLLETNYFKSKIFVENHNLFGMKQAVVRINMANGTKNNHAYYDSWLQSLYDYALYSSTYLYKIRSEEDYFNYLKQHYAEDPYYVNKLQNIIKRADLITLFEN